MTRRSFTELAVAVFLLVVVFSPTIIFGARTAPALSILTLGAVACALANILVTHPPNKSGRLLSLALLLLAGVAGVVQLLLPTAFGPAKVLSVLAVALVASAAFDYHGPTVRRIVAVTMLVNLVFVGFQLAGGWENAYAFEDYANDAKPVDLTVESNFIGDEVTVPYLPQLRPSGAFPAPTYLSIICIFLWNQVVANQELRSRTLLAGVGSLFVLAGSTVGTFLAIVSIVFITKKKRLLYLLGGATGTMALYAWFLPYHFRYNFNQADIALSFLSRLDTAAGGESILQQNPLLLGLGCLVAAFVVLLARRIQITRFVAVSVSVGLPVMVHDVSASLIYWLIVFLTLRRYFEVKLVGVRGAVA